MDNIKLYSNKHYFKTPWWCTIYKIHPDGHLQKIHLHEH